MDPSVLGFFHDSFAQRRNSILLGLSSKTLLLIITISVLGGTEVSSRIGSFV